MTAKSPIETLGNISKGVANGSAGSPILMSQKHELMKSPTDSTKRCQSLETRLTELK